MKEPNKIQTVLSVASCKLTRTILRRTGRGGTALPGTVAMKVSKNILSVPAKDMEIVVVTGTNGKTTTCNMIEHALTEGGHDCHRDKSGANLLHGIASDLICDTNWLGKPRHHYAVLEVDEAALKQLVPLIRPKVIVVTNLFTDQADRFGGVENTLAEVRKGVKLSPESTLVLNAEDTQSASLALGVPNKVIWYGLEESVGEQGKIDLSDAGKCPKCGGDYEYDYHIYAHLGGFRCPKCGYSHNTPDVAVTSIDKMGTGGSTIHLRTDDQVEELLLRLLRGGSRRALAGMRRRKGNRIRPLLGLRKQELLDYLAAKGQPFCVDSSNQDTDFLRNRIRLQGCNVTNNKTHAHSVLQNHCRTAETVVAGNAGNCYHNSLSTLSLSSVIIASSLFSMPRCRCFLFLPW